jgi:hypothetical protein
MSIENRFPPLPLDAWEDTLITLHIYVQVIGKVRLALAPRRNHWWNVPLYISEMGLTTTPMPYEDRTLNFTFDFVHHRLEIRTSKDEVRYVEFKDGLSVAEFYDQVFAEMRALGIQVEILAKPYKMNSTIPFAEDREHASYKAEYVERFWSILVQVDAIFKAFSTRFIGKTSPVHLFWHSFDLAVTRFSGRPAPDMPDADPVTQDAYSHEVISFGFWPGDQQTGGAAFYGYVYPEPENLTEQPLQPSEAMWQKGPTGSLALFKYDDARQHENPDEAILSFLQSVYDAGVKTANWDRTAFAYPHAER